MPITRANLLAAPIPTPVLASGQQTWFGVPLGDWAVSTSGHASLPSQTVLAGTTPGSVRAGVAFVTPGRTYVASVWCRSVVANAGTIRIIWTDANYLVVAVSATTAWSFGANTTGRIVGAALVAPAGAVMALIDLQSVDGSAQFTAGMVEQTSTIDTYFDGNTPGARWTGPAGYSPSVIGASALTPAISYDESLGRVRVAAAGAAAMAGRLVLQRRRASEKAWQTVRGGPPVSAGVSLRSADDYEFAAGVPLQYRVATYPAQNPVPTLFPELDWPLESVDVPFTTPSPRAWVKFMASPSLNRKVTVLDWSEIGRPSRLAFYDVRDAAEPVVVLSGHSSRRTTLTLRTWTIAETEALDYSLKQGIPGFLHLPDGGPLPSMYFVAQDYSWRRPSRRSEGGIFTVPIVEVAAPPASIYAPGSSYSSVLAAYADYAALLAAFDTYRAVVD